jgi:hypothetical protein
VIEENLESLGIEAMPLRKPRKIDDAVRVKHAQPPK